MRYINPRLIDWLIEHRFTCHRHTNHTCLYSPAARHHRPLAGTHCACPWRDGQTALTWVDGYISINVPHRELNPDTVTHPSTNHARRRVTSLMCAMPLLLSGAKPPQFNEVGRGGSKGKWGGASPLASVSIAGRLAYLHTQKVPVPNCKLVSKWICVGAAVLTALNCHLGAIVVFHCQVPVTVK